MIGEMDCVYLWDGTLNVHLYSRLHIYFCPILGHWGLWRLCATRGSDEECYLTININRMKGVSYMYIAFTHVGIILYFAGIICYLVDIHRPTGRISTWAAYVLLKFFASMYNYS